MVYSTNMMSFIGTIRDLTILTTTVHAAPSGTLKIGMRIEDSEAAKFQAPDISAARLREIMAMFRVQGFGSFRV